MTINKILIEPVTSGGVIAKTRCAMCGQLQTIDIPKSEVEGFLNWYNGGPIKIQDACPTVTPSKREVLISGVCPCCFSLMDKGIEL